MTKLRYLLSFFFLVTLGLSAQDIPPRPNPPKLVNDLDNQLNPTEVAALEQKLVAYNDSTSTQIVVVIVSTVEPYAIGDYAFKLGRDWGVGQEGKNNGIVLLWAATDRKVFIATGYGMEGAIPDAIAKRIISQVIIPEFKNSMYYRGLDRGVDAIIQYASGEYQAEATGDEEFPSWLLVFIIAFIVIMIIMSRNRGGGSGGGGYRNTSGGPVIWPYSTHTGWGSSSGNWGGGGSSGGFGGFGGGSFGGGGAGGDY